MMETALEARPLEPLRRYKVPAMPTDASLRLAFANFLDGLRRKEDAPVVSEERLHSFSRERSNDPATEIALLPVFQDLTLSLSSWVNGESGSSRVRVVVLPPCDGVGVLGLWARRRGLDLLDPPAREAIIGRSEATEISGSGVLVIPALEAWFLRHRNGLGAIRALFESIAASDRRVLIGCGSWAWAFLVRAVEAGLFFNEPLTLQPFDGARLRVWLREMARQEEPEIESYRLSHSGEDVFADGESDYFEELAARSRGIPWVASSLWHGSLNDIKEKEDDKSGAPEGFDAASTLWIAAPSAGKLPEGEEPTAMLILQSLLIHGGLSPRHLQETVPLVGGSHALVALLGSGLVHSNGGEVRCSPDAYPAVRRRLENAGFPLDGF